MSKVREAKSTGANTVTQFTQQGRVTAGRQGRLEKLWLSSEEREAGTPGSPAVRPTMHRAPLSSFCCAPHDPACPSFSRLTHGRCCQCLSPHNLGWSQAIQKITELAFSSKPSGKNKAAEGSRGRVRVASGLAMGMHAESCTWGAVPLFLTYTDQLYYSNWEGTPVHFCTLRKNMSGFVFQTVYFWLT